MANVKFRWMLLVFTLYWVASSFGDGTLTKQKKVDSNPNKLTRQKKVDINPNKLTRQSKVDLGDGNPAPAPATIKPAPAPAAVKPAPAPAAGNPAPAPAKKGGFSMGNLNKASMMLDVADKAVGLAQKVDQIITAKLDAHFNAVSQKPEDLIKAGALNAIKESMGKGKEIVYEQLRGYKGIDEFQPSGWMYQERPAQQAKQQDGESQKPQAYPMGAGFMMMSGCFGKGYQKSDPCYSAARFVKRCVNQIDSANFIGVGFDITKTYSAESRRRSIVQRTCANKGSFLGEDVPDNMNAFGIYDYSISTRSFQSADRYRQYLAEKSGTTMSSGVFKQESESFQGAQSVGYAGLLFDFGASIGYGSSSTSKAGLKQSASLQKQMEKDGSQSSTSFIAVLEADLKLYEITLDHSSPDDLSESFFEEFMRLPTSYYAIGADIKLQDFILRYGTHFIKAAKFGGRLNIYKTSKRESKMTQDQFASASQSEFQSMMSTLRSSYLQTHVKANYFGIGGQSSTKKQKASASKNENTGSKQQSTQGGSQMNKRSEFIETTVDAKGGDPVIAAAIMDFYTPAFKGLFIKWLASIPRYPQPYEMSFGKITELFDVDVGSLFKEGEKPAGCLKDDLEKDVHGRFFIQERRIKGKDNTTVILKEKIHCKYGQDKNKFMEDFKARRLSLERAIAIYIAQGKFSVSNFELAAGSRGCETDTINFLTGNLQQSRSWPKWENIKRQTFKVLFQLPYDLPMLKRNVEFEVKFHRGQWYTDISGGRFTIDNACRSAPGLPEKNRVCVAGLKLLYEEEDGYFTFDQAFYNTQKTYDANITKSLGDRYIARAEAENIMKTLEENTVGEVPCNVKWTNSHRIDPQKEANCIHFSAASEGDIFIIFSSIPKDYSTWLYLQMSPTGIAFYRAMRIEKVDRIRSSGTLGDDSLFETFFVCVSQVPDKDISIMYGKAPAQREIGQVLAAFTYPRSSSDKVSFYTFGAGDKRAVIDNVRVITETPDLTCAGGLIKVGGLCGLECHQECNGCHQAHDHRSCTSCRNEKHFYTKRKFECLSQCPPGFGKYGNMCKACKAGYHKIAVGNGKCSECPKGYYQKDEAQTKCQACQKGYLQPVAGQTTCAPCLAGYYQSKEGQWRCKLCAKGTYQNRAGRESCLLCEVGRRCPTEGLTRGIKCLANQFNDLEGQTVCQSCAGTTTSVAGSASCGSNCTAGKYLVQSTMACELCPAGQIASAAGMSKCDKCPTGYTSNTERTSCQDENECNVNNGGCSHICSNTQGAFKCTCRTGFTLIADSKNCNDVNKCTQTVCQDVNECAGKTHYCQQTCVNLPGGYKCKCGTGFLLNKDQKTCRDINECDVYKGGCTHTCTNTVGSFDCSCRSGYTLDSNKRSCSDVNECSTGNDCSDVCVNNPGSYTCTCSKGYQLKTDLKTCEDKNECSTDNGGCSHKCTNSVGSYKCTCFAGYTLSSDKHKCTGGDARCQFRPGDGNGRTEENIGKYIGKECIKKCVEKKTIKNTNIQINGITIDGTNNCWCEGGMYSISTRNSKVYETCFLNTVNVAMHKPAYQSSTMIRYNCKPPASCAADVAVDGNYNTHSYTSTNGWWTVDLQKKISIGRIRLYLLPHSLTRGRYKGLKISSRTSNALSWKLCREFKDPQTLTLTSNQCLQPTIARFVKIQNKDNSFGFFEVYIEEGGSLGDERCSFVVGDGLGSGEYSIGNLIGIDCIDACIARKKADSTINGVTVKADGTACWCEKGMNRITATNAAYRTCFLDNKNRCLGQNGGCSHECINKVRSYECKCPLGMKLKADKHNCELAWYKIFNERYTGHLFPGQPVKNWIILGYTVYHCWIANSVGRWSEGREYWQLIPQGAGYYKIYNKLKSGPLIPVHPDSIGDRRADVVANQGRDDNSFGDKILWKIVKQDGNRYKIFNKLFGGPLFSGDTPDSYNDRIAWVSNNVNYAKNGKELWEIKQVNI